MKKLLAMAAVVLGISSVKADDSYLYWMITENYADFNTGWTYARIKAVDSDTSTSYYLNIVGGSETPTWYDNDHTYVAANEGNGATYQTFAANLSSYVGSSWSYFLELYNSDGGWIGMAEGGLAYGDAGAYLYSGGIESPGDTYDFGIGGYSSVPEPNSAMLLLLGLSALALRRKQKKA